jgi:branched-subunit amino acid transport protein
VVGLVGLGTVAMKAVGPVVLGGGALPHRLLGVVALLAPALLAALVVTQVFAGDRRWVVDERLLGMVAAVMALRLRAGILVVVLVAAATTAVARIVL